MSSAILLALCAILLILPGAWIGFGLFDRRLAFSVRLAFAAAFSPLVLGLQVLVATRLGLPFEWAARLALLNIGALWLMRPGERGGEPGPNPWALTVCIGALAAALIALWTAWPLFRLYSWHNMMQSAAVYEIMRLPKPLEEWDFAGAGLYYAWIGHIQIAAISALADRTPQAVFPVANLVALSGTLTLLAAATLRFRPADRVWAVTAATVAFLSPNLLGIALSYVKGVESAGEIRTSTVLHKFFNFDMMTSGVTLAAGAVLCAVMATKAWSWRAWLGLLACTLAVGIIYPLAFPPVMLLAGASWAAPIFTTALREGRIVLAPRDGATALGLILVAAVFLVALRLIAAPEAGALARLASPEAMIEAAMSAIKTIALWAPLLALALVNWWRSRDPTRLALIAAGSVSILLFIVAVLPMRVQYKFVAVGLLAFLPLAADEAIGLLKRVGKAGPIAGALIAAGIVAMIIPHLLAEHAPRYLIDGAPPVREVGAAVEPTSPELAWTLVVRDRTPADTILISPPSRAPVSVFSQRASFIAHNPSDNTRFGYTMMQMQILNEVKSMPAEKVMERLALVADAYPGRPAGDYSRLAGAACTLGRPLAIVGDEENPFIAWLKARGMGQAIDQTDATVVWLVPAAACHRGWADDVRKPPALASLPP